MTGSEKTGPIAYVCMLAHMIFTSIEQMIKFHVPRSKQAILKWSAFAGCFSEAQWQTL